MGVCHSPPPSASPSKHLGRMDQGRVLCSSPAIMLLLLAGFTSGSVVDSRDSMGRRLLQVTKRCPVNFEYLNYTIITSSCKGPLYLPGPCCASLREFLCPYQAEVNDPTNDCSLAMFSYIDLNGNYTPGLFSSECGADASWLMCPSNSTGAEADANAGRPSPAPPSPSPAAAILVVFLLMSALYS